MTVDRHRKVEQFTRWGNTGNPYDHVQGVVCDVNQINRVLDGVGETYDRDMSRTELLASSFRRPTEAGGTVDPGVVARYRDLLTGCLFVVAEPAAQPGLWREYLQGAETSYRKHDVESVLEYDSIIDGRQTALFFVALDESGAVVGGMRVQGPYSTPAQAHALTEWAGRPGTDELRQEIASRLAQGVVEMKTGWVQDAHPRRSELTDAMARMFVHALRLMDVRYVLGTVAEHARRRWQSTGGTISENVCAVAYPDDRYRTVPMWWDRETFADTALAHQLPHIVYEAAQLPGPVWSDDLDTAA